MKPFMETSSPYFFLFKHNRLNSYKDVPGSVEDITGWIKAIIDQ
jgi:hypothetical protein